MSRGQKGPGDRSATASADTPNLPASPPCPFCERGETELMNAFGSHASVSTYWCRLCRSPFEMLKWRGQTAAHPGDAP